MAAISPITYHIQSKNGQTALSLVFVIGGIIVLFSATLAFLALSFLNSTYGFQASNRAAALAEAGVNDAMLRLLRDKGFESAGYCLPYHAGLPCPSEHAQVTAAQHSPAQNQVTVTAQASVSRYGRKYEAVFSVNPTSSLVRLVSQEQVPL